MKKRGLSAVITTLIIVLLVLVAVGVVWVVIANLITSGTEEISLGKFTLNMEIKNVEVKDSEIEVKVKRNAGKGDLTGIKFLINDGVDVHEFTKETTMRELGQRTFTLDYSGFVKEISIAPVFTLESGKESVGNEIDFEKTDYSSCLNILDSGQSDGDGVYKIDPDGIGGDKSFEVYCDMTTDGGGWTLIGKTVLSGLTSDERDAIRQGTWEDYTEDGYGSPETSSRIYWMPLKYWNILTEEYPSNQFRSETDAPEVRVMNLVIADSSDKYRFDWDSVVPGYTELYISHFKGMQFTTPDQDNDLYGTNCAVDNVGYNGGWWYRSCGQLSMLHNNDNLYSLESNVVISVSYNYLYFR